MKRQEKISVWSPEMDDDVFIVDCNGKEFEPIMKEQDDGTIEQVGSQRTGNSVTFEYHFPTSDIAAEDIIQTILDETDLQHSPTKMNGLYTVYDMKWDGAFDIGCENENRIVIHAKPNTQSETIKRTYKIVKQAISNIQVIRYRCEY